MIMCNVVTLKINIEIVPRFEQNCYLLPSAQTLCVRHRQNDLNVLVG